MGANKKPRKRYIPKPAVPRMFAIINPTGPAPMMATSVSMNCVSLGWRSLSIAILLALSIIVS